MPTRQEQKQAVLDVVSPAARVQSIFDLREQYFVAAAKAGTTASALALAINAYLIAASNQRDRKPEHKRGSMNWLALAQTLIPIAIQIAETKHGEGNGPLKNDTATTIVRGSLDMVANAIGQPAPPEVKDRGILSAAISAAVQVANTLGGVQKQ